VKGIKHKRKRNRLIAETGDKDLEDEEEIENDFKTDFNEGARRVGIKRKKKYMYNDAGVPMEPFTLEKELRNGVLTSAGAV